MLARMTQFGITENQNTHATPATDRPGTAGILGKNVRDAVEIVENVPA